MNKDNNKLNLQKEDIKIPKKKKEKSKKAILIEKIYNWLSWAAIIIFTISFLGYNFIEKYIPFLETPLLFLTILSLGFLFISGMITVIQKMGKRIRRRIRRRKKEARKKEKINRKKGIKPKKVTKASKIVKNILIVFAVLLVVALTIVCILDHDIFYIISFIVWVIGVIIFFTLLIIGLIRRIWYAIKIIISMFIR